MAPQSQPNTATPYAQAALDYHEAGWFPIPVRDKTPPAANWTGHLAAYPNWGDVLDWVDNGHREHGQEYTNLGLRMAPDVIGIDVDQYGTKHGKDTFDKCIARWGELPPTWRSTSRDDGISGIRFYRIPTGLSWPGQLPGGDVELIHKGHRYAVAWPSLHPEGRVYRIIGPDGLVRLGTIPRADELPDLPDARREGRARGRPHGHAAGASFDKWPALRAPRRPAL